MPEIQWFDDHKQYDTALHDALNTDDTNIFFDSTQCIVQQEIAVQSWSFLTAQAHALDAFSK